MYSVRHEVTITDASTNESTVTHFETIETSDKNKAQVLAKAIVEGRLVHEAPKK